MSIAGGKMRTIGVVVVEEVLVAGLVRAPLERHGGEWRKLPRQRSGKMIFITSHHGRAREPARLQNGEKLRITCAAMCVIARRLLTLRRSSLPSR